MQSPVRELKPHEPCGQAQDNGVKFFLDSLFYMERCHDKYNFGLVTKNREKIEVYIHVFTYIYFSTLYYNEDINF